MNCSRNEIEKPNKKSVLATVFSAVVNIAADTSAQFAEERLSALAIAVFESEGGLIPTDCEA